MMTKLLTLLCITYLVVGQMQTANSSSKPSPKPSPKQVPLESKITYDLWKTCEKKAFVEPEIFTVQGEATISLVPNLGIVRLGIDVLKDVAAEALESARQLLSDTVSSIRSVNSEVQITTSGLSVQPEQTWDYKSQKSVFKGYRVRNSLIIKTQDISSIGRQYQQYKNKKSIIDQAVSTGVNRIDSISFTVDPEVKKMNDDLMIDSAFEDARQRAELTLAAINYRIVGIKYLSLNSNNAPVYQQQYDMPQAMAMNSARAAPTQVYAGTQDQSYRVTVGYMIEKY